MPGLLAINVTSLQFIKYKKIKFYKNRFIPSDPIISSRGEFLPSNFWKKVQQLYFENDHRKVICFMEEWGFVNEENFINAKTKNRRISEILEEYPIGIEELQLRKALEWFKEITNLWVNGVNGGERGVRIIRQTLGEEKLKTPWSTIIPKKGFVPFYSVYNAHPCGTDKNNDNIYGLPNDSKILISQTIEFISNEIMNYLENIHLRPITKENSTELVWAYQPKDWIDAAVISFFLEELSTIKKCACGCGMPASSGSKYYDKNKCRWRAAKRKERDNI